MLVPKIFDDFVRLLQNRVNWTTRGYTNSRTGHLADWSTRGLDKFISYHIYFAQKYHIQIANTSSN